MKGRSDRGESDTKLDTNPVEIKRSTVFDGTQCLRIETEQHVIVFAGGSFYAKVHDTHQVAIHSSGKRGRSFDSPKEWIRYLVGVYNIQFIG